MRIIKLDDLRSWLMRHQNEYLVDTHYLDMYGYNGSKNWNSILKRFIKFIKINLMNLN